MKKIGVLTSGGDSPGMNAGIRAVYKTCAHYGISCIGIRYGYQGLIENDIFEMQASDVKQIIQHGGTVLQTARSKEFMEYAGREKAFRNLQQHGLDALITIGGDGTFTGAMIFQEEFNFPIIGLPGTIDNDIFGTDNTIGYDTALNTVIEAVDKIRDTATSHHRIFFVEVMGRNSGKIAYHAAIASGADHVLIPETKTNIKALANDLAQSKGSRSTIVIVAEGDDEGDGQQILSEIKTFLPEFDLKYTKLGHVQRGGSPSVNDRILATRMGDYAVSLLHLGVFNKIIGMNSGFLTTVDLASLDNIINSNHQESIQLLDRLLTRH